MGKTSLANTFAEFLKSRTEGSKPVLTKGTDLEFTKVMQLYDGLSVNQKKEIKVQVEELQRNGSKKLVKLNETSDAETSDNESPSKDTKKDVQLKLVDMGGHSATLVLTTAVKKFAFFKFNW